MNTSKLMQGSLFVVAVIGSLVLLNVLGLRLFGRVDVTRDGAYTLSKATKDTLSGLDESITVTAYFTESLPANSGNICPPQAPPATIMASKLWVRPLILMFKPSIGASMRAR